jgi:hypothetical protein
MKSFATALSAALLAGMSTTASAGLIRSFAPNLVFTTTTASAEYYSTMSPSSTLLGSIGLQTDEALPGVGDRQTSMADSGVLLPATGELKDQAQGSVSVSYTIGNIGVTDSFGFHSGATASAVSATIAGGEPAYAVVTLKASFGFYLDPSFGGVAPGTPLGFLSFDALAAAHTGERYFINVYDTGHHLVHAVNAGDPASSVTVYAGEFYQVNYAYTLTVPYGTDPTYSVDLQGSLAAVPEPSVGAMFLAGFAGLAGWASRRRSAGPGSS